MNSSYAPFLALLTLLAAAPLQAALVAYGVNSSGDLFRFDPDSPQIAATVGNLGFVPAAIDFRPAGGSTSAPVLYALQVRADGAQVYTVNTSTGTVSALPTVIPLTGDAYSLAGAQTFGFDVNPRTLQADGSVRFRLVASGGANLRLNSDTGAIAAVDSPLLNVAGPRSIDAAAYTNSSVATGAAAGTTTLYVMDFAANTLNIQNPPNAGTITEVGPFGVTIDANAGIAFDIYTDPASTDDSILGDRAFATFSRDGGPGYLLYDVNLSTGQVTGGRLVGGGLNFSGGFSVIPEPSPILLGMAAAGWSWACRRSRRALP